MVAKFFVRGLAGKVVGHITNDSHHKMDVSTIDRHDLPFSLLDEDKQECPMIDAFGYKVHEIVMRQYPQTVLTPTNYSFSLFVQRKDGKDDGLLNLASKLREEVGKGEFLHKHEKRMMNGTPNVNFSPGSIANLDPQKVKIRKPSVKLGMYFTKLPDEEELFWIIYRGAVSPLMKVFRSYG